MVVENEDSDQLKLFDNCPLMSNRLVPRRLGCLAYMQEPDIPPEDHGIFPGESERNVRCGLTWAPPAARCQID